MHDNVMRHFISADHEFPYFLFLVQSICTAISPNMLISHFKLTLFHSEPLAWSLLRRLMFIWARNLVSLTYFGKWSCSVLSLSPVRLCHPMNHSTPGLPVHHQLPEFSRTHVHQVSDAIQPSHPLSSPSPPVPNPSQHHSLFQWVNSSHEVAKVLEFQL